MNSLSNNNYTHQEPSNSLERRNDSRNKRNKHKSRGNRKHGKQQYKSSESSSSLKGHHSHTQTQTQRSSNSNNKHSPRHRRRKPQQQPITLQPYRSSYYRSVAESPRRKHCIRNSDDEGNDDSHRELMYSPSSPNRVPLNSTESKAQNSFYKSVQNPTAQNELKERKVNQMDSPYRSAYYKRLQKATVCTPLAEEDQEDGEEKAAQFEDEDNFTSSYYKSFQQQQEQRVGSNNTQDIIKVAQVTPPVSPLRTDCEVLGSSSPDASFSSSVHYRDENIDVNCTGVDDLNYHNSYYRSVQNFSTKDANSSRPSVIYGRPPIFSTDQFLKPYESNHHHYRQHPHKLGKLRHPSSSSHDDDLMTFITSSETATILSNGTGDIQTMCTEEESHQDNIICEEHCSDNSSCGVKTIEHVHEDRSASYVSNEKLIVCTKEEELNDRGSGDGDSCRGSTCAGFNSTVQASHYENDHHLSFRTCTDVMDKNANVLVDKTPLLTNDCSDHHITEGDIENRSSLLNNTQMNVSTIQGEENASLLNNTLNTLMNLSTIQVVEEIDYNPPRNVSSCTVEVETRKSTASEDFLNSSTIISVLSDRVVTKMSSSSGIKSPSPQIPDAIFFFDASDVKYTSLCDLIHNKAEKISQASRTESFIEIEDTSSASACFDNSGEDKSSVVDHLISIESGNNYREISKLCEYDDKESSYVMGQSSGLELCTKGENDKEHECKCAIM